MTETANALVVHAELIEASRAGGAELDYYLPSRVGACIADLAAEVQATHEMLQPFFTATAFESLDRKRCSYPPDPAYAADYWRGLVRELLGEGHKGEWPR